MRLWIFLSALATRGSSDNAQYPLVESDSFNCMMQVEVPARGRILFHSRGHERRHKTLNDTLRDGIGRRTSFETSASQIQALSSNARRVAHVSPDVPHSGLQNAFLFLWSRVHVAVKGGPEGPMIGILLVLSASIFAAFAAFTLYFKSCTIRDRFEEAGRQNGGTKRRFKGPPRDSLPSSVRPAHREEESFGVEKNRRPFASLDLPQTDFGAEFPRDLPPVAVVDSHLSERDFSHLSVVESQTTVPPANSPPVLDQPSEFFAQQAEADFRSLGYNFDPLRRNVLGLNPLTQMRDTPSFSGPGPGEGVPAPPIETHEFSSEESRGLKPFAPRTIQRHETLLPGTFATVPPPPGSTTPESGRHTPATPQSAQYRISRSASAENFFADQASRTVSPAQDFRSLGHNVDPVERNPFGIDPGSHVGRGSPPRRQASTPSFPGVSSPSPSTQIPQHSSTEQQRLQQQTEWQNAASQIAAERAALEAERAAMMAERESGSGPGIHSVVVSRSMPPLEMPQSRLAEFSHLNPSAPRSIQYHSIGTVRGPSAAPYSESFIINSDYEGTLATPVLPAMATSPQHAYEAPVLPSMYPSPQHAIESSSPQHNFVYPSPRHAMSAPSQSRPVVHAIHSSSSLSSLAPGHHSRSLSPVTGSLPPQGTRSLQ